MKPKVGKAGTLVSPAAPKVAVEADKADPGEAAEMKAEQAQAQSGKYGATKVTASKPGDRAKDPANTHFIEIELAYEDGTPAAGEKYEVTFSDGAVDSGTLDHKGKIRLEHIAADPVDVTFPDLDKTSWKPK